MSARSWLYVPADQPQRLARAAERGADALILDLEDGVAAAAKDAARRGAAVHLAALGGDPVTPRWVRVNADTVTQDVEAVAAPALAGIVLAKAEAHRLEEADAALAAAEARLDLPLGALALVALVETAAGLRAVDTLAAGPRVARLAMGEADLAAELGVEPSADARELLPARMAVVSASAAAGIGAPTASVSTDFADLERLRAGTEALRRMGFRARAAIHPAQVAVINEVFRPDPEAVARARALVDAYEAAVASGAGVVVGDDGRMVDLAVVRPARELLQRAELYQ